VFIYLYNSCRKDGQEYLRIDLRIDRINTLISNEFRELMITMRNDGESLIGNLL